MTKLFARCFGTEEFTPCQTTSTIIAHEWKKGVCNNSLAKSQGIGSKNRAQGRWQRRVCWTSTCCSFNIIHWEQRSSFTQQQLHVFLFLVIWVRLKFWFLLNFLLNPCLVGEEWRESRRKMKVWIFWLYWLRKISNLIFLYNFRA